MDDLKDLFENYLDQIVLIYLKGGGNRQGYVGKVAKVGSSYLILSNPYDVECRASAPADRVWSNHIASDFVISFSDFSTLCQPEWIYADFSRPRGQVIAFSGASGVSGVSGSSSWFGLPR